MTALHYAMRDGLKLLHGYETVAATRVCGFAGDSRCKPIEGITDAEREMMKDPAYGLYIVEGLVETENADREAAEILPGGNMYELAEALLANGADVNARMKYPPPRLRLDSLPWLNLTGATPFMLASASLDYSGMEMLLEHGADPLIKTEVRRGVLEISTEGRIKSSSKITVRVTAPNIESVEASGVARVDLNGVSNGTIKLKSSGASKVIAAGDANELDVKSSGASKVDAESLRATDATVKTSGASTIRVTVSGRLVASASGAGKVLYGGTPANVEKRTSGAGKVAEL